MKHMGSFAGSLLLRSFDRAGRVYSAMKCRGYGRQFRREVGRPWRKADVIFTVTVCMLCVLCRIFDVGLLLGSLLGRCFA